MAYNHEYPYVDPNRYNADWILHKIKEIEGEMQEFEALNKITFAGEWDITKQYPAWTIVNVGGLTGYISLKPVPAGINYDNTEYWAFLVDYTVTIADLQNRVIALENEVVVLDGRIDMLTPRRIVGIGDSYVYNYPGTNWIEEARTCLGIGDDDSFIWGEGQAGYLHIGNQGHTFETLLDAHYASITDPDTITDVISGGGTNDFYYYTNATDLANAITSFVNKCKSYFPNARVWVAFNGYVTNMTMAMKQNYLDTIAIYGSTAAAAGARFIDCKLYMHISPFRVDTMHPNADGCRALGRATAARILGANPPVYNALVADTYPNWPSDVQNVTGTRTVGIRWFGENTFIRITDANFLRPVTITAGTDILLFSVSENDISWVLPKDLLFEFGITISGGDYTPGMLYLAPSGSQIGFYFRPQITRGAVSGYEYQDHVLQIPTLII